MKKVLKIFGKLLLGILITVLIALLVIFLYNRIMLAKEDELLKNYPGQLVEVNGHNMNIFTEGGGNHTLVFLSPSQDTSPVLTFRPLYSKLSDEYRIVVAEKFGYGMSDIVGGERNYEAMVDEIRTALSEAGVNAPYILCPYSKSGLDALIWAQKYPDEVEGIISIDMAFPGHMEKLEINEEEMRNTSAFMDIARGTGIIRLFVSDSDFPAEYTKEEKDMGKALVCRKFMNRNLCTGEISAIPAACDLINSKPKPNIPVHLFLTNGTDGFDKETWQGIAYDYTDEMKNVTSTVLDCGHYEIIDAEADHMAGDIRVFVGSLGE